MEEICSDTTIIKNNITKENECEHCSPILIIRLETKLEKKLTKLELFILTCLYEYKKSNIDQYLNIRVLDLIQKVFNLKNAEDVIQTVIESLVEKDFIKCPYNIKSCELKDLNIEDSKSIQDNCTYDYKKHTKQITCKFSNKIAITYCDTTPLKECKKECYKLNEYIMSNYNEFKNNIIESHKKSIENDNLFVSDIQIKILTRYVKIAQPL